MTPTAVHTPTIVAVRRCTWGIPREVFIGKCACGFRVERRHQLEVSRALAEHRRAT